MRPLTKQSAEMRVAGMRKLKDEVIDKVSDVMSYPTRRKYQKQMIESEKKYQELKQARTNKEKQREALEKTFKPQNMKGFKQGVGVGP